MVESPEADLPISQASSQMKSHLEAKANLCAEKALHPLPVHIVARAAHWIASFAWSKLCSLCNGGQQPVVIWLTSELGSCWRDGDTKKLSDELGGWLLGQGWWGLTQKGP